jgi:hypothetical protein
VSRRFAAAVTGVVSCAAIVTTAGAYGSPRLEASQDGNAVTIDIAQSLGDDPTPSLEATISGALRLRPVGTWISIWVPYVGAAADPSWAVASPAVVGTGSVSFAARARGRGAVLTGIVHPGGAPRPDARVRITGAPTAASQRVLGTARTNGVGRFTFRALGVRLPRDRDRASVVPVGICSSRSSVRSPA